MKHIATRILLVISFLISAYFFITYEKGTHPFYGDSMGYYIYLPTTFIYHSHKALNWLPADRNIDNGVRSLLQSFEKDKGTPKGYIINKYTYGVALMEMPFFFIAHGYEKLTGGFANGYSRSYMIMIKVSSLFYGLLGMIILFRILRRFFENGPSFIATLIVFIGTNLFWFTLYQSGMAHVPLFFLYALLIYTCVLIHEKPKTFLFILAGLTAGLITIIRPVDIVCLLIPLLYNVYNRDTLRKKITLLKEHYTGVLLFAIAFVIPIIPQLLYWKKFAGSYLYYSYGDEKFNWDNPRILDGLFSYANGWLIYTPVLVFSILGLVLYRRIRPFALLLYILVPVYIYIVYSWHCYNYINGLGSRPMIHLYPLLAIPLAAFLQYVYNSKFYLKFTFSFLFVFFILINLSYSVQQAKGILLSEESNKVYNMHMLFKLNATYADLVTLDVKQVQPEESEVEKISTIACETYDTAGSDHYVPDTTGKSRYVYHMFENEEYHPKKIVVQYSAEQFKGADWLKCSGSFLYTKDYTYYKHLFILDALRGDSTISWSGCRIDNKIGLAEPGVDPRELNFNHASLNTWGRVYFFVKIPPRLKEGDVVRLDVWNIAKRELYFDDICLELYRNKKNSLGFF